MARRSDVDSVVCCVAAPGSSQSDVGVVWVLAGMGMQGWKDLRGRVRLC